VLEQYDVPTHELLLFNSEPQNEALAAFVVDAPIANDRPTTITIIARDIETLLGLTVPQGS
jgi:hypothetical protein